jgi:hypothetical protein
MNQIKLFLFPSFVGEALEAKAISSVDLENVAKLKNIFSPSSVDKILYLNNLTRSNATKEDCQILNALGYDWLLDQPVGYPESKCKTGTLMSFLTAIQHDGDELLSQVVGRTISQFAMTYDVVRIRNNTYGLMMKSLTTVDNPASRKRINAIHMERVLQKGIVDNAVTQSVPYTQYVNYL